MVTRVESVKRTEPKRRQYFGLVRGLFNARLFTSPVDSRPTRVLASAEIRVAVREAASAIVDGVERKLYIGDAVLKNTH